MKVLVAVLASPAILCAMAFVVLGRLLLARGRLDVVTTSLEDLDQALDNVTPLVLLDFLDARDAEVIAALALLEKEEESKLVLALHLNADRGVVGLPLVLAARAEEVAQAVQVDVHVSLFDTQQVDASGVSLGVVLQLVDVLAEALEGRAREFEVVGRHVSVYVSAVG